MAATQQPNCRAPAETAIKASVTFYAVIDLRLKPEQKPRPPTFPENDPTAVLLPLYDLYAGSSRAQHLNNPRLNPVLAARETLPERILLVVPGVDILVAEQTAFAERVNGEDRAGRREKPRVELIMDEKGFHGYLECKAKEQSRHSHGENMLTV
jgi:hypothetical protein